MARDAEERKGIAKEDSLAAEINKAPVFEGAGLDRPAARSPAGDGAPAVARRRETVEQARLGAWMLVVTAACSVRTPRRRIRAAAGIRPTASLPAWPSRGGAAEHAWARAQQGTCGARALTLFSHAGPGV
jgi:hypothetical protein